MGEKAAFGWDDVRFGIRNVIFEFGGIYNIFIAFSLRISQVMIYAAI